MQRFVGVLVILIALLTGAYLLSWQVASLERRVDRQERLLAQQTVPYPPFPTLAVPARPDQSVLLSIPAALLRQEWYPAVLDLTEEQPRLLFAAQTEECARWKFDPALGLTLHRPVWLTYALIHATGGEVGWQVQANSGNALLCRGSVPTRLGEVTSIRCALSPPDTPVAGDPLTELRICRDVRETPQGDVSLVGIMVLPDTTALPVGQEDRP